MSFIDEPLSTIALCWRVERRDGIALGLTDHDRDLTIDGLPYRAAPGMTPSAIKRGATLEADTMDVAGMLSSAAITETDLLAGRWDGARVQLLAVDWAAPGDTLPLGEGTIGTVETRDDGFNAELKGPSAALDRPVAEETSAECRAELGDRRCRVAMAGRRRFARVLAGEEAELTVDGAEPVPNAYGLGLLRWLGGENVGLESAIAVSDRASITLRRAPPFAVAPDTLVELVEGCDKTIATCAGRFANAENFRGEPYLPGVDLLTRYPGG